jgi:hypothetical protein
VNRKKDEDLNDDDDYVVNEDYDEESLNEEDDSDYIEDEESSILFGVSLLGCLQ